VNQSILTDAIIADIVAAAVRAAPTTALVAGASHRHLGSALGRALPDCRIRQRGVNNVDAEPASGFDIAIAADLIEYLEKPAAVEAIGRLRDRGACRLLLLAPVGGRWPGHRSEWAATDFYALALRREARYTVAGGETHLYTFDMRTYKETPDWLNARHWAHPELFDKYWW
jgi:hypothetical protein